MSLDQYVLIFQICFLQIGESCVRLITIKQCKPGMKLAKKIFSEEGVVLLAENMELTARLIERLEANHVYYLYIEDHRASDIEAKPLLSEETLRFAIKEIKSTFNAMQTTTSRNRYNRPFIAQSLKSVMDNVLDELLAQKDAMIMLMNMGSIDNYLYQHSLNVCVYTCLLTLHSGMSREQIINIGLGALLHDIGKTMIDVEVLKKSNSLSPIEFEEIKLHTTYGFEMLKDQPNLPLAVAHCAFQHHERIDGSGYPRGIKGEHISEDAKWIGIVDSYDAMTTNRIYNTPILPHDAMDRLYAGSGTLYDQKKLAHFRDKVVLYPIGLTVKLSNGTSGIVADYHSKYPHRPIIRVLTDEAGQLLKETYDLDLSKKLNVMITNVNDEVINI